MTARHRKLLSDMAETLWLIPRSMVVAGILSAVGLVTLDRSGVVPQWLIQSSWLYNAGGTGARTSLGADASSTIGVAGMVFSITIAALSLAAGQMGPRLPDPAKRARQCRHSPSHAGSPDGGCKLRCNPVRLPSLQRQADLILGDATRNVTTPSDLERLCHLHRAFTTTLDQGAVGHLCGLDH